MNNNNYSVLMSVYYKEKPEFLSSALESIFSQSILTNDFVLVCDGPLTKELDEVIDKYASKHRSIMNVIRLDKNGGLGNALNIGLPACKNEIIMRCDSDDISRIDRAEKQLALMDNVDICSSNVSLFYDDISNINGIRSVPETNEEIIKFSKRRSPFNHPSVMYKKSSVLSAGGYIDLPFKEDWYLWTRMIINNCVSYNFQESLVYMRENVDTFKRRANKKAYKSLVFLFKYMKKKKFIGFFRYLNNRFMYFCNYISPNFIRKIVYENFYREKNDTKK